MKAKEFAKLFHVQKKRLPPMNDWAPIYELMEMYAQYQVEERCRKTTFIILSLLLAVIILAMLLYVGSGTP